MRKLRCEKSNFGLLVRQGYGTERYQNQAKEVDLETYSCVPFDHNDRTVSVTNRCHEMLVSSLTWAQNFHRGRTVVSGLGGLFNCISVPPSLRILAFFLCNRLSWFFFILAISSSKLDRINVQPSEYDHIGDVTMSSNRRRIEIEWTGQVGHLLKKYRIVEWRWWQLAAIR